MASDEDLNCSRTCLLSLDSRHSAIVHSSGSIRRLGDSRLFLIALSRSRRGLYVFCRSSLLKNCHKLCESVQRPCISYRLCNIADESRYSSSTTLGRSRESHCLSHGMPKQICTQETETLLHQIVKNFRGSVIECINVCPPHYNIVAVHSSYI